MGKKGGGGSGGSGAVSYPAYMETMHSKWLTEIDTTIIPEFIAANPFIGASAFNPTIDLGLAWDAVCEFDAFVDALSHETDYESAMTKAETVVDTIIDDTYLNADIAAFADVLDDELNDTVLPQFKAGMRNINAVMTSAFVLGEGDIYAKRTRDVAKYGTELRLKSNLQRNDMIMKSAEIMLKNLMMAAQYEGNVAEVSVDAKRIAIVAQKEQTDMDLDIDEAEARWDGEAYLVGSKMLASISGGVASSSGKEMSKGQSALSGALAGASIGATFGAPGAIVGGIIGGIGGLFS